MRPLRKLYVAVLMILAIYIAFPCSAQADGGSLYFIVGSPYEYSGVTFPVTLRRLGGGGLETVLEITDNKIGSLGIKEYLDERLVIVRSVIYAADELSTRYSILEMDSPLRVRQVEIEYSPDYSDLDSYLFNIPREGLYQGSVLWSAEAGGGRLLGFSLTTFKNRDISHEAFKYVVLGGKIGGGIMDKDFIGAGINNQQKIVIGKMGDLVEMPWTLPNDLQYKKWKSKLISIQVNNEDILVIAPFEERIIEPQGMGNRMFYILNKETNKWHKLNLKGSYTMVRGFSKWLGGYISVIDKTEKKSIPGLEKKGEIGRKTGLPVAERFQMLHEYPTGTLFIYNTDTRKKYEIETGQGDSEVLLVEGDYVYYRVYDEIYKSKIGKNKLEEPVLLVKDDAVPDIHWAFFGPKVDVPPQEESETTE